MTSAGSFLTTTGIRLEILPGVYSPELDNRRDILVQLPGSYPAGDRTYPVLYMHDGQNLFDPATSYAGDWRLGRSWRWLRAEGWKRSLSVFPTWEPSE